MEEEQLKDKMVIDTTGKIVGKCMGILQDEDDENALMVQVKTQNKEMIDVEIPVSTIQAVGETIILSVEIEGLVKDKEIVPYNDTENKNRKIPTEGNNSDNILESEDQSDSTNTYWTIYKSIRSKKG